jgi:hypothetical protein
VAFNQLSPLSRAYFLLTARVHLTTMEDETIATIKISFLSRLSIKKSFAIALSMHPQKVTHISHLCWNFKRIRKFHAEEKENRQNPFYFDGSLNICCC